LKDKGLYDILQNPEKPEKERDKSDKAVFEPAEAPNSAKNETGVV